MKIRGSITAIIITLVSCIVLLIVPGFIRKYSIVHGFWPSYIAFFAASYFLYCKMPRREGTVLVSFLVILSGLCIRAVRAEGWYAMILPSLVGFMIACTLAYVYHKLGNTAIGIGSIVTVSGIGILITFFIYPKWLNQVNFRSYNEVVQERVAHGWQQYIAGGQQLPALQEKDKLLVLDFYYTGCGVCFKKFPLLEGVYNKFKGNPGIMIYAVHVPVRGDMPDMGTSIMKERNYTFPVLIGANKIDSLFHIRYYPTVIVVRNDSILFRGDIENVTSKIEYEIANSGRMRGY